MSARPTTCRPPSRGFTLLELITIVAILGVLALMIAPYLASIAQGDDLSDAATLANDALREAQSSAASGKNNARYGVHFEQTQFTFFQGSSYSAGDANNVVHALNQNVTITSVSLGGSCTVSTGSGACDVHFASRRGTPTENGTIVFTGATGRTKTVSVSAAGVIDVN